MLWKIEIQQKKLENLFQVVKEVEDEEIQAHLSKLLCIRASGLLETAFKNLILEYLDGAAPREVHNYITREIRNVSNLKQERLIYVLSNFSQSWADELQSLVTEEQFSSLNSLISIRNNIAHGENDNLTFRTMEKYYLDIKEIVLVLKLVIKKPVNKKRY